MRYFLTTPDKNISGVCSTEIKDLRRGLRGKPKEDNEFLHKYMTLTRCDLLFADKAILIEGTTERLLLPKMIEKMDAEKLGGPKLSSQYISIVEVGGAYAHRFFHLLNFLELRSLIITDIDSAKKNSSNKLVSCRTSDGTHTTNGCIKAWFNNKDISPLMLIEKPESEKVVGRLRLAYQVPEAKGLPCGPSCEEAFILANKNLFDLAAQSGDLEDKVIQLSENIKKSDFALEYAIEKINWIVPRYIAEGLSWLAQEVCVVQTGPKGTVPSKELNA